MEAQTKPQTNKEYVTVFFQKLGRLERIKKEIQARKQIEYNSKNYIPFKESVPSKEDIIDFADTIDWLYEQEPKIKSFASSNIEVVVVNEVEPISLKQALENYLEYCGHITAHDATTKSFVKIKISDFLIQSEQSQESLGNNIYLFLRRLKEALRSFPDQKIPDFSSQRNVVKKPTQKNTGLVVFVANASSDIGLRLKSLEEGRSGFKKYERKPFDVLPERHSLVSYNNQKIQTKEKPYLIPLEKMRNMALACRKERLEYLLRQLKLYYEFLNKDFLTVDDVDGLMNGAYNHIIQDYVKEVKKRGHHIIQRYEEYLMELCKNEGAFILQQEIIAKEGKWINLTAPEILPFCEKLPCILCDKIVVWHIMGVHGLDGSPAMVYNFSPTLGYTKTTFNQFRRLYKMPNTRNIPNRVRPDGRSLNEEMIKTTIKEAEFSDLLTKNNEVVIFNRFGRILNLD